MKKVTKAVIPAAGFGTRLLPATKALPKEMLPIVDKPAIQHIVEEVINSGITDIIIITGRNKRAIEDHFDKSYELEAELQRSNKTELLFKVKQISSLANIHYVRQKEPLGLGDAVNCAKSFIGNEPFAVLSGDDVIFSKTPSLSQMLRVFVQQKKTILGVQEVERFKVDRYGCIDYEELSENLYKVNDIVEKPLIEKAPSNMAVLGRYILTPEIFTCLQKIKKDESGEFQLTDAVKLLTLKEEVLAYKFEGKRFDIGDKLGFLEATLEVALTREDLKQSFEKYVKAKIQ